MKSDEFHDVIIIGTGAGGGTIADRLAATGKKILIGGRSAERVA